MARTELKVSRATEERVKRRVSLANAPYVAKRRDFTSKRKAMTVSFAKAFVWASL